MSRTVDEIKEKVNIVDVIDQVVQLKKSGANYQGLCPFHKEKTPSFSVSEERQFFHCFGCDVGGDVIKFVEMFEHLDFKEAVEKLAGQYNIPVEWERNDGSAKEREELYRINREAAIYYYKKLREGNNPGMAYALERGLTPETLHSFGIGYAPDEWTGLYDHLSGMGVEEEKLTSLGLVTRSKGRCYDRFRGRLIFPILNTTGKVIGFGGRILGQGEPKYLNSPESSIFLKKNNLYGLYYAKKEVAEKKRIILVEGYMDVVSLFQAGVRNVAASLGTALTENQVRLIKRYTGNAVLSYDSDKAGVNAALRGMDLFQAQGMDVRVLHVTEGKDPDEFLKKNGREAFLRLVDEAPGYADYRIAYLEKQYDLDSQRGRVDFLRAATKVLLRLGPVEADLYTQKLAEQYGISREAIRREMEGERREEARYGGAGPPPREGIPSGASRPMSVVEKTLLHLFMEEPSFLKREEEQEALFQSPGAKAIYRALREVYKNQDHLEASAVAEQLEEEEEGLLQSVLDTLISGDEPEALYRECLRKAEEGSLRQREQELIDRLALADEEQQQENIQRLSKELMDIQNKLKK